MNIRRFAATALAIVTAMLASSALHAQGQPTRSIVQIDDNLYRAQNNQHFTVFLVTPEGIILSDPINRDFSEWLRDELNTRFGVPVRYVLYSHHHWDHASGGVVFASTADFVGHRAMARALAMPPSDTPLPADAASADRNRNGRLERSEAQGNLATMFDNYDEDGDDMLSGAELARGPVADVFPANRFYEGRATISLGGEVVEMIHVDTSHAPDMSVLRFPNHDAAFFVDIVSLKRVPFRNMPDYEVGGLLSTIRTVESLDFSIGIGGHGDTGSKSDVSDHRRYVEELRDAVAAGIAAGRSLEQLQSSIALDRYSDWASYDDWYPLNIEGMYRMLTGGN